MRLQPALFTLVIGALGIACSPTPEDATSTPEETTAKALAGDSEASLLNGKTTQTHNGLTCKNSWGETGGTTHCSGNSRVKWRLHVACAFQSDHDGPWNYGTGSDAFECFYQVQTASVRWGN